jgi:predicted kinase
MASDVPLVVVVTGPPASGKSSIAKAIAEALPAPLLAKDPIKEALFDGLGTGNAAWSKKLGLATYGVLFLLVEEEVRARRSCVLEANFDHNEASAQLSAIQLRNPFRALQIVCTASREVLLGRFVERSDSRHPGHIDDDRLEDVIDSIDAGRWRALELDGELIEVDTTDWSTVDLDGLLERARATESRPRS